jgi:type I restriction enzyme S subunit
MNRVNVPQLRFKGFESDWKEKKIGKVYKINAGGDIDNDRVSFEKTEKFRYPIYANAKKDKGFYGYSDVYKIESGTITVAGRGVYIGIAHARDHQYYPIVRLLVLKPLANEDIYFSENVLNRLNLFVESTGVPQLTAPQFSNYKISLPTLPEQQKIASFLSAVDEKIQQLSRKKELLEQYKKGVMQQLFSGKLRFKDENGNDYAEWEKKKLGEVAIITMGQSPESISYNTDSLGMLLIQGNADIKERVTLPRQWTSQPTKTCEIGDLILTVRAPVGSIAKSSHSACIGRGVCSIINNKSSVQEYLYQFLLSYESKWTSLEQGSTFTAVSGNDIKSLKLNLPQLPEQHKIASFLSSIDAKIESANQQITQTQTFKKGLLQQMFV